jgi:hypothetical protein
MERERGSANSPPTGRKPRHFAFVQAFDGFAQGAGVQAVVDGVRADGRTVRTSSVDAAAITRAPAVLASWMAMVFTPAAPSQHGFTGLSCAVHQRVP